MTLRSPTILIVDDEAQNRRLLAVLLRPEGYATTDASSGEEALASIGASAPDLILLDLMMPGMDGNRVASILKADPLTANIPIIMVTARMERSARLAGLDAGAEEFLTKPVDRAELWLRVRNLLRLKAIGDLQSHSANLERQVLARTADLQRFRSAMDATADAIMLVSRTSMRFIEVNETACTLLGYEREALLAIGPWQLYGVSRAQLDDEYGQLISGRRGHELIESTMRRKDGTIVQVEMHCQALGGSGGDWTIVAVVRDISERKETENRLSHLAHHDPLTGLPNRASFYETLIRTLSSARENGWCVAVVFIDLDNFKDVNDTLGHAIGDSLLLQFSDRLVQCVRVRDTVGRLGGDEFALILVVQDKQQGPALIVQKIRDALLRPFLLQGHEVNITASIGITLHPDDSSDPETLIRYADTAMYQAKQAGRDTYRFFTAQMNIDVLARLQLERALRKAIDHQQFVLFYQPKVHLDTGAVAGVEALLRWNRPGYGVVSPAQFIGLLEETGMIVAVGRWVLVEACRQAGLWLRSAIGPIQISVNVSGRQFAGGNLDADIAQGLADNQIPADLLELELTETSLMADTVRTTDTLHRLKLLGVHISIDDFGTGYSSLAYLRRFPIDKLKIDIAFIRDVTNKPEDAAIVLAIIRMAHSLNLEVIAEGVETQGQLHYLRRHQCDQIQGYYFSRPLPVDQVTELLHHSVGLVQAPASGRSRKTLLIIDDEPSVLEVLVKLLDRDGYHILCASNAAEGFQLLALNEVQVILCDQGLPLMSGTDFLDQAKELYPKSFRIILSDDTDTASILKAVNSGAASRFYSRPWADNDLRNWVRDAFRQRLLAP